MTKRKRRLFTPEFKAGAVPESKHPAGVQVVLSKPFELDEFLSALAHDGN
jgi:transposase-like protein